MAHELGRLARITAAIALVVASARLDAQAVGLNLRGDIGLLAGTPPLPGLYGVLLYYGANYDGIRDAEGHKVAPGLDVNLGLMATPGIIVQTKSRILGGLYGFQIIFPFSRQRASFAIADTAFEASQRWGYTDMYVQPIMLGWVTKRADYKAGYAVFAPTGGSDHSLDMWAHELSAGSTVYFDPKKLWSFAALASYEIHHKKRLADLRVGDLLTIEGGLGRSFMKDNAATAGVAYVAQWKLSQDSGDDFPRFVPKHKNRVYGAGPEIIVPVYGKGTFVALLNVRYIWEFGGRSTFQGQALSVSLSFAELDLQ